MHEQNSKIRLLTYPILILGFELFNSPLFEPVINGEIIIPFKIQISELD